MFPRCSVKRSDEQGGLYAVSTLGWAECHELASASENSSSVQTQATTAGLGSFQLWSRSERGQCQASRMGTTQCTGMAWTHRAGCRHSHPLGWNGHPLPWTEEATWRQPLPSTAQLSFLLFNLGTREAILWILPTPTPLPLVAILEMSKPLGMERCSPSFCPKKSWINVLCEEKTSHSSLGAFCVLFSLPNMYIWSENSFKFHLGGWCLFN